MLYVGWKIWDWWGISGCQVTYVYDGDTFEVKCPTWYGPVEHTIRVRGYDTPEKRGATACPNRAVQATKDLNAIFSRLGKNVDLTGLEWQEPKNDNQSGRYIATVTLANGRDLSDTMLDFSDHARAYYPGSNWDEWDDCQ